MDGRGSDGALTGHAGLHFGRMPRRARPAVDARQGQVELRVQGLHPEGAEPLASRGDVALSVALGALDARIGRGTRDRWTPFRSKRTRSSSGALPMRVRSKRGRSGAPGVRGGRATPRRCARAFREPGSTMFSPTRSARHRVAAACRRRHRTRRVPCVARRDQGRGRPRLCAPGHGEPPEGGRGPLLSHRSWRRQRPGLRWPSRRVDRPGGTPVRQRGAASAAREHDNRVDRPAFGNVAARSLASTCGRTARRPTDRGRRSPRAGARNRRRRPARRPRHGLRGDGPRAPLLPRPDRDTGRAASKLSASLSFDRKQHAVPYAIDGTSPASRRSRPSPRRCTASRASISRAGARVSPKARCSASYRASRDGTIALEPHPSRTAGVEGTADFASPTFAGREGEPRSRRRPRRGTATCMSAGGAAHARTAMSRSTRCTSGSGATRSTSRGSATSSRRR